MRILKILGVFVGTFASALLGLWFYGADPTRLPVLFIGLGISVATIMFYTIVCERRRQKQDEEEFSGV